MMRKKSGLSYKLLFGVLILALLLASQLTRFENNFVVSYDGEILTAQIHGQTLSRPLKDAAFSRITASFHKSMVAENGLSEITITDESGTVFEDKRFAVFLFGRDVLGTMIRGEYPEFKRTFGDWLMDRYRSKPVVLYDNPLPSEFAIEASVLGKGRKTVELSGNQNVRVEVRDGLLDNDLLLCVENDCVFLITVKTEKILANFSRIANFFIEVVLLAIIFIFAVKFLSSISPSKSSKNKLFKQTKKKIAFSVGFLMVAHFLITSYFTFGILGGVPHIPDSADYYRQAILLGEGKFLIENFTMEPSEAFASFAGRVKDDALYFRYNHFWPALLALPVKFGVGGFLNPVLSAIALLLVYLIASLLYDRKVGIIAALVYCFSPFVILLGGSFMLHTPTNLLLLAALYCLLLFAYKQKTAPLILGGAFLAYAFGLRQMSAVAFSVPVFAYLLISHYKVFLKKKSVLFFAGFVPVFLLFFLNNYIVTGNPLQIVHPIAFGAAKAGIDPVSVKYLVAGINYLESAFGFLPPVIFHGFIPMLFISLAFVPLIVLRNRKDYFLISVFLAFMLAHLLVMAGGLHGYGPRYLFESFFALFILASRAVVWSIESCRGLVKHALAAFFVLLLAFNIAGLYQILPMYKNYNTLNTDLLDEIKELDLENSIVIVHEEIWQGWGIAATLWDPYYEKSFFIRKLPENAHHEILKKHPDKKVYIIHENEVLPYEWQE